MPVNHGTDEGPASARSNESFTRGDERQRIARELHDSTSQLLVVLQLQLHRLDDLGYAEAEPLIDECKQTIKEIRRQIRDLNLDQR